jgi:hypothetical protein
MILTKSIDSLLSEVSKSSYKLRPEILVRLLCKVAKMPIGHITSFSEQEGYSLTYEQYMKECFDMEPSMAWKQKEKSLVEFIKKKTGGS